MKKETGTKTTKPASAELPVEMFDTPRDWERWLKKHHTSSPGLWMRIAKKGAEIRSTTYDEAVELALCYGWIDGQKKSYDDASWIQKFTPRGPRSIWSKINREKVGRLIENGKMQPAGLAAVERAKANGQWEAAYESQSKASLPDDFHEALDRNPKAKKFFATLNSANRYAMFFRIQTAKKPETRARRIQQFVEMLERHEKLYR
jgi:uncharacterized protein YdeI (YjbR/CyaY-like superfamily)